MMTSHNRVVQSVKAYFETLPIAGRVIDVEEPISFGTKVGGFADVVLRSNARFVAIAECKNPWDSSEAAKAQLKSYLCATGTLFGVLAIGKDPRNWVFCENQGGYYFREVRKDDFEKSVSNWKQTSSIQYREDTARQWENTALQIQKSIRKWQVASVIFAVLFTISLGSVFLAWRKPMPEPIVYITRTGKKYHTYDCEFLEKYAKGKFAIYLDEAQEDYDPCGVCNPNR